jgi:uncharacterized small protein (DUF1192 family)
MFGRNLMAHVTIRQGAVMVFDTDDLDPIKKKPQKKDLSRLSVGDLKDYIADLKAEIVRTEAEIVKKEGAKKGADSFFKS